MHTQNLNEATKLYEILGKYIPLIPQDNALDFVNDIFENIKKSGNYAVYFDALTLMTGKTHRELSTLTSIDVLELFINALMDWHIIELAAFFRNVGYKDGL